MDRRFAGYERFSGLIVGQALARLVTMVSLYTNYVQPSFKLIAREKIGSRTRKRYDRPQTPCQRLPGHAAVAETLKEGLRATRSGLDPLYLLAEIRASQPALAALAAPEEPSKLQKKACHSSWPSFRISGERATRIRRTCGRVNLAGGGLVMILSNTSGPKSSQICRIIPTPAVPGS